MSVKKTEELNIYERLAKIREMVEVLQKNKKGFNYMYVTEDEILAKLTAGMKKYKISLIPHIVPETTEVIPYHTKKTKVLKNGEVIEENVNELLIKSDMMWRWICDDSPDSYYDVPWAMVGQQGDASQAFGSGLTYSSRYFLLKYFNIATSESDPDNWRSKQQEALLGEDREVIEALADNINEHIAKVLKENSTLKPEIVKFLKSKIKVNGKPSADFYAIKDVKVAGDVYKEIQKKFPIK